MPVNMLEQFKAARSVGTPLIAIKTTDPEATMVTLQKLSPKAPIIVYDVIRGWSARNKAGDEAINEALDGKDIGETQDVVGQAIIAHGLPKSTILFMLNVHRFMEPAASVFKPDFVQALWLLRDVFKANLRSAVLLSPDLDLPSELHNDFLVFDEPLPGEADLRSVVEGQIEAVNEAIKSGHKLHLEEGEIGKCVDALRGLAAYPAEQRFAMSVDKLNRTVDVEALWGHKEQMISETRGLGVGKGKRTFSGIGGCNQAKQFALGIINGREAPRVVVFIDEGEKVFAGATGGVEGNGVDKDAFGNVLTYMEDEESDGMILVGPAGTAKSEFAKTFGGEAGIPTIFLDINGMKGSLMGESEKGIRHALKVITAVGGGRAFFIMTCNKIGVLPPELKRRFASGIWYFDIPTEEERPLIWDIHMNRYKPDGDPADVNDRDWTGAEIRNCCRAAYRQRITVSAASQYIIPVAKADPKGLEGLRREASGRYLSASNPGVFKFDGGSQTAAKRGYAEEE